jgi:TonB family protein
MRARNTSLFLVTTVLVAVFACGQTERKVISKVAPVYSPLLKQKMIGGVVRIVAVVSPSGTVQRIEVVGGNPILVTAAQEAVTKWKFTPAETETREPVTFTFDPANHH